MYVKLSGTRIAAGAIQVHALHSYFMAAWKPEAS